MTLEEFESLPALTGCPGKPACDQDCLCGDHRDVFRLVQRIDAKWRDTVIAAREARDHADLQVGEYRKALVKIRENHYCRNTESCQICRCCGVVGKRICEDCKGTGEIGLADANVPCPKCCPEWYEKKSLEKRNHDRPKCLLCGAEAVGKVGAEPRCEAHV